MITGIYMWSCFKASWISSCNNCLFYFASYMFISFYTCLYLVFYILFELIQDRKQFFSVGAIVHSKGDIECVNLFYFSIFFSTCIRQWFVTSLFSSGVRIPWETEATPSHLQPGTLKMNRFQWTKGLLSKSRRQIKEAQCSHYQLFSQIRKLNVKEKYFGL